MDTERVTLTGGVQADPTNDDEDPKPPLDPTKTTSTRAPDKEPRPPED